MNVLLDACVWGGARAVVREAGHHVEMVSDWPRDPGDDDILARAWQHKQVLVTLDKDFGAVAIVRQQSHCGIVRLVGFRAPARGKPS